MIKRLIFDLDNTLIMWIKEYSKYPTKLLDCYNKKYDDEYLIKLENIIDNYSDIDYILTKEKLLNAINDGMHENYPYSFIEDLIAMVSECSKEASAELVDTLEYLSAKYDLVVLSNWFSDSQSKRLELAGIDKYFSNVYGPPDYLMKPSREAFIKAMGSYNRDECIMIGDSITCDIDGANMVGMNAILCNFTNANVRYDGKIIYKIEELKDLL